MMRHAHDMMAAFDPFALFSMIAAVLIAAAILTFAACKLLMPLLQRYALARPNARSSHKIPTPQGGGIAVLIGLAGTTGFLVAVNIVPFSGAMITLALAAFGLGILGGWDDIRPLPASLRLAIQGLAVAAVIMTMPLLQLVPWPSPAPLPDWFLGINFLILILAGVWFVNLTNFMDGLDWLSVAGFVPLSACMALMGALNMIDTTPALIAAALCGALLGFAPLNKPVARLFLGDVGSLPIGLIVAWLLYSLAVSAPLSTPLAINPSKFAGGGLIAALILPLYHLMDATLTLFQRLRRGERVWQAHRCHAYQRATDHGFTPLSVAGHVLVLNIMLCALALTCVLSGSMAVNMLALVMAMVLTLLLIRKFSTPRLAGETS